MESKDINLLTEAWASRVNKQVIPEAQELDNDRDEDKKSPFPEAAIRDLVKRSLMNGFRLKINTRKGAYDVVEYLGRGAHTKFVGTQPGSEDVTIDPKDIMSIIGMERMSFDIMRGEDDINELEDDDKEEKKEPEEQAGEILMRAGALGGEAKPNQQSATPL